jgi:hypothetical protein
MKKIIAIALLISISFTAYAQKMEEEKAIKTTIENFFKGFHKGDVALLKTTIHTGIISQTTHKNNKEEDVLSAGENAYDGLIKFASNVKPTNDYFEKILSYTIHVDGNLASVWTPYEFYNNKKLSHCGSNSFQLFNNNGNWEIMYIVDTRRKNDCNTPQK